MSVDSEYKTYKAASGEIVGSLLGGSDLKYEGHKACICGESAGDIK